MNHFNAPLSLSYNSPTMNHFNASLSLCYDSPTMNHFNASSFCHFVWFMSSARRTCVVEICQPWGNLSVSRGMSPLKYFHDLTFGKFVVRYYGHSFWKKQTVSMFWSKVCFNNMWFFPSDFNKLEMAWGVDIEPAYAMVTIAFGL